MYEPVLGLYTSKERVPKVKGRTIMVVQLKVDFEVMKNFICPCIKYMQVYIIQVVALKLNVSKSKQIQTYNVNSALN